MTELNLDTITQDDLDFCASFLTDVSLAGPQDIVTVSMADLKRLPIAIHAVEDTRLKSRILSVLPEYQQSWLVDHMMVDDVVVLFGALVGDELVQKGFKRLPAPMQQQVLNQVFKVNKPLYQQLKDMKKEAVEFEGPVPVRTIQADELDIERRLGMVTAALSNPDKTVEELGRLAMVIQSEFLRDECERFLDELTTRFLRKPVPLSSKENFVIYVKYLQFVDPFIDLLESTAELIKPTLDRLILMLLKMGNLKWVFSLLNQLPKNVLIVLIQMLQGHTTLRTLEKRTGYAKLLNSLISTPTPPSAQRVATVLGILGLKNGA